MPSPRTRPRASAIWARCGIERTRGDVADGEALDAVVSGIKVGSVIDGGSVMLGIKKELASLLLQ